ncbi:MAG: hypothetical protein H6Q92_735 [Nitrospirae bacterium]|jgi:hypothetical protein|nr:hypothetical protein [Nitrospirota bacterium]
MTDYQDKTDEWLFSELRFVDRAIATRWGLSDKQSRDECISFQHQLQAIKAEIESRGLEWHSNE